jgi:hypothetical protein
LLISGVQAPLPSGVLVVDEPGRLGRLLPVPAVRQLRAGRQDLQLDPGPVHQPQPRVQLGAVPGAETARHDRAGLTQVHQQVDVVLGPVVRVHVDSHLASPPRSLG